MMAAGCVSAALKEVTGFPPYRLLAKLQEITGVDSVCGNKFVVVLTVDYVYSFAMFVRVLNNEWVCCT